jgi:hypothetical protein
MTASWLAPCLLSLPLLAQSNAVPGLDVSTYDVVDATVYGRRGPAFPNGEVGINIGHSMCNSGTTFIPWVGNSGSLMVSTYPRIASLLARESDGRMVQVSGKSYCKHSRTAFNFSGGPCGPCQSGPAQTWRPTCSDVYGSGFSSSGSLGPTTEIDPWLGTWNPVGSYFDRGDPEVAPPANTDGILSPISWGSDPIKNRMIVAEADLDKPGAVFWGQVWVSVIGEPGDNRGNNATTRQAVFTRSGTTFSASITGTPTTAPVLTRWTGASTALGRNGYDDGHFMVGVKVTGPVGGLWHYEYAIHNLDNHRGGAAFRIPICSTARVANVGFRDIDRDPLNEWQFSRTANELAWLAPASNPQDWNTIYNVWFDSDAAPRPGAFAIDQARIGPGALSVAVASSVPGQLWHEHLGAGCGAPATTFVAVGQPTVPNPNYALRVQGAPSSLALLVLTFAGANTTLGNGCTQWIDTAQLAGTLLVNTDASGSASWSLPVPAAFPPLDLFGQAAVFVPGGPVFGEAVLSSALRVRVGGLGCP